MKNLILVLGFLGVLSFSFASPGDSTLVFEGSSITQEQKESIEKGIISVIESIKPR